MQPEEARREPGQLRAPEVLAQAHEVEEVDAVAAVAPKTGGQQVVRPAGPPLASGHHVRQAALPAHRETGLVHAAAQAARAHGPQPVQRLEQLLLERLPEGRAEALGAPVRVQHVPARVQKVLRDNADLARRRALDPHADARRGRALLPPAGTG